MRFLHFSTSDGPGGAARAAHRLHSTLGSAGHFSQMLVRQRTTADENVHAVSANPLAAQIRRLQKHLPWSRPARSRFTFNHDLETGLRVQRACLDVVRPVDAVCLHWVANFLSSRSIRGIYEQFRCPFLCVMMDQEPVTGGCHYSFGCQGYESQCGNCPLLVHPAEHDRSRQVFLRKQRYLADLPITFVAPTSWAEQRVRRSSLFGSHRVERIPLPIDTGIYHHRDRLSARGALGIPREKHVIFFGSSYLHEPRKGGAYLIEALEKLNEILERRQPAKRREGPLNCATFIVPTEVLCLMVGQNGGDLKRRLPFPVHDLGYLRDERLLATAYRAADVFICPSIEDAGPMMIPEAMLCGTPVVAFNTGGAPDLIANGRNGYLAQLGDAGELAHGIKQVLESPDRAMMGEAAAHDARKLHEPQGVANRYVELVADLVASERGRPSSRAAA